MRKSRDRTPGAPGPAPTEASLHDAALRHLARYAVTAAGLTRTLDRRCVRWAREAATPDATDALPSLRQMVRGVVARLQQAGAVDDAAFAAARARSLTRAGRSHRAIAAHLAARGVAAEATRSALPDDAEGELAAALSLARRRRLGPFRDPDADADPRRELGVLARAGFTREIAATALDTEPSVAEALVARLRRG